MSGRVRSLGSTFLAAAALAAPASAAPASPAIVTGQDAGWPDVRAFDRFGAPTQGSAPWGSWQVAFSPYPTYQKGVRVAVADVDGDGRGEIVTAPGGSGFTELRVFDGVDHAFFNDTGQRYDPDAAAQAYQAMLDWFGEHLAA